MSTLGTDTVGRTAAVLVILEGVGVGVIAVREILALTAGDTASATSALALVVLTAVAAAALIAFGVAVWRGRSWGRSGSIVAQVLILAVALGAATGQYAEPLLALLIAAPAVVTLVLLMLAARDAARRGRDDDGTRGS